MLTIKQKREAAGLTQNDLSGLLGVGRTTVTMWESGEIMPRAKTLIKLAEILGCKVDDLLRKEEASGES